MSRKKSGKPVVPCAHACGGLEVLGCTVKHSSILFAEARSDRPIRASHKAHLPSQLALRNAFEAGISSGLQHPPSISWVLGIQASVQTEYSFKGK